MVIESFENSLIINSSFLVTVSELGGYPDESVSSDYEPISPTDGTNFSFRESLTRFYH